MRCPKCGTEVRSTARFCNTCGASVGAVATGDEPLAADHAALGASSMPPLSALASSRGSPKPRSAITRQLDDKGFDLADAVTEERAQVGARPSGVLVQANGGAGPAEAPHQGDDQLPWPLPTNIIMDGRYRVETVLASGPEESSYRVTDLRGYERCWACGKVYGASGASDRFCPECGADMLARDYVMRERRVSDAEARAEHGQNGAAADSDTDAPRMFVQGGRLYRVEPRAAQRSAFPRGARLLAAAATDLGQRRTGEQNEDSALVLVLDRVHENQTLPFGVFVVADGLGGHANGQRASRLAVNVLVHTILRQVALPAVGSPADAPVDETILSNLLADAVRAANGTLCAANREAGLDAGSTIVTILIYGETAHIANVGDSRAYVCNEDGLRRITTDHSLVQQLVAGGLIAPDEVYTHPQRNQIFRSLGDDPDLAVDLFAQQLQPGMRLLLCSDGLWEMVRDPQIEAILRSTPDPQAACDALIEAANEGGGEDNITAVVIEAR